MAGASSNPWVDYIKEVVAHGLPENNQSDVEADSLGSDKESCSACSLCQSDEAKNGLKAIVEDVRQLQVDMDRFRDEFKGDIRTLNQTLNEVSERNTNDISENRQIMMMMWEHVKGMRTWTTETINKLCKGQGS